MKLDTISIGVIRGSKLQMLFYFLMKIIVFIPINDPQAKEIFMKVIYQSQKVLLMI